MHPSTCLSRVESGLNWFFEKKLPFGLNESTNSPRLLAEFAEDLNGSSRAIVNASVDSIVRIATAIPTTLCDIGYGVMYKSVTHLKDGALTIPKASLHFVLDTITITGSSIAVLGIVATSIAAETVSLVFKL